jgi:NitT/TauT family transport system ATP-binding protein
VHADNVELTYEHSVQALAGVSLEVATGQLVAVVGPSGCGKSTLLRLVAGLVAPSRGRLAVSGLDPPAARRNGLRLSFVFQDPTLLPWRSVRGNVRLPLELADSPSETREAQIASALEMVGLADFASRYPNELSGGMRMRASLARALVIEPHLLLLDEPFAALDDITRQSLGEELSRLHAARGWTAIFVTHNIAEAVYLSHKVLVMSARPGRIMAAVDVPFAMPRGVELRSQAEFAQLTGEVSACLRKGRP